MSGIEARRGEPMRPSSPEGEGASSPVVLHNDPVNILIVDDEPRNLTVVETILDDPRYRLVRATSADQALIQLVAKEFAVLVLDIRMPSMSGFELAHLIKQRKKTEQVPIIFLTAYYNEDQHILEGYGTGAVDYLHKPVNPVVLRSKVAIFADLHRKSRALEVANRALVAEVTERRAAQAELHVLNETLEERVRERTSALAERILIEEAAREELRASEELNRSLMDSSADGVQILDLAGRLLDTNLPGLGQFEAGDRRELVGREWPRLWPEAARSLAQDAVDRARAGTGASFTVARETATGATRWWNVSMTPVRSPLDGSVLQLLAVCRDVSEARQREAALRSSAEQKDKFIATLAHELRNPLAPIRNAAALLGRARSADSSTAWCREVIDRQVNQMTRLLDDLLDVSRVTRSKLTLRRERISVALIVERAAEIARPVIDEAGLSLHQSLPAEPVYVDGDLARLAQVLSNILINAAKFSEPDGSVTLEVEAVDGEAILRVSDTGIGIAPAYLDAIFEMFCQIPSSGKATHGGLGIGLALAKALVELHGGRLVARSAGEGKGSEFTLTLPVAHGQPPQEEAAPTPAERARGRPTSILVVDDLRDSADSLGRLLESMGHDVRVAYDGEEALRVSADFQPAVVFIDLGMPDVDGFEVARRIRAEPWGRHALLAAQTGWGQDVDRQRTQAAGFDGHMVKPLDAAAIEAFLRRAEDRAGATAP